MFLIISCCTHDACEPHLPYITICTSTDAYGLVQARIWYENFSMRWIDMILKLVFRSACVMVFQRYQTLWLMHLAPQNQNFIILLISSSIFLEHNHKPGSIFHNFYNH